MGKLVERTAEHQVETGDTVEAEFGVAVETESVTEGTVEAANSDSDSVTEN